MATTDRNLLSTIRLVRSLGAQAAGRLSAAAFNLRVLNGNYARACQKKREAWRAFDELPIHAHDDEIAWKTVARMEEAELATDECNGADALRVKAHVSLRNAVKAYQKHQGKAKKLWHGYLSRSVNTPVPYKLEQELKDTEDCLACYELHYKYYCDAYLAAAVAEEKAREVLKAMPADSSEEDVREAEIRRIVAERVLSLISGPYRTASENVKLTLDKQMRLTQKLYGRKDERTEEGVGPGKQGSGGSDDAHDDRHKRNGHGRA